MRLVLDACVLYPPLVRALILSTAQAGLFNPIWSQRILDEWRLAWLRKQGDEDSVDQAQITMAQAFPSAIIAPEPDLEVTLCLPDPADTHVLATAITGEAPGILTFNLRDFPRRTLAGHGIDARHPDGLLWELLSTETQKMTSVVQGVLDAHDITPDRARAALKRARLSRFGKAWQGMAP